jgi:hypothetical protein
MYARKNQIRIKFPKCFDFSTPFQGQKEETAHAGALHNEVIADDDLLSIKPPSTKTPEKNCTNLLSFSTGCKKSFEILREKCAGQRNKNLTPKLREKCDSNYARERSLCAICKRRPRRLTPVGTSKKAERSDRLTPVARCFIGLSLPHPPKFPSQTQRLIEFIY